MFLRLFAFSFDRLMIGCNVLFFTIEHVSSVALYQETIKNQFTQYNVFLHRSHAKLEKILTRFNVAMIVLRS